MNRVYPHDFASVPVGWAAVSDPDTYFMQNQVAIKKQDQIFVVSNELIEDAGNGDWLWDLMRVPSWRERAERLRRDSTLRLRISRAWAGFRHRLAVRVGLWLDPNLRDEWE